MENEFQRMLSYCEALTFNNNREWFHANHNKYIDAKNDFESLVETVKFKFLEEIPAIGTPLFPIDAAALCYRIPRDARSLGGRPPYNPSWRAFFAPDRHSWKPESYFMKIGIDETFIGTALFLPKTEDVYKARNYFAANTARVLDSVPSDEGFELTGDKLKKMPSIFSADHPLGDILKMKYWQISYNFQNNELKTFEEFGDRCMMVCTRMEKLRTLFMEAYEYCNKG